MAKSPDTAGKRTQLGVFLSDYRRQQNLTQKQLQEKLGHGTPGYISKIEIGLIGTPEAEFLKALAREVDKPVEDLIALSRQPEQLKIEVAKHEFNLAFGHSLWGAPIFHAAYEGRIREFGVTSSAKASDQGIDLSNLNWIEPDTIPDHPGPDESKLVALSAGDVLKLLRTDKADVGAVPGNIVPPDFIRVGTIVDSAAGCKFVCAKKVYEKISAQLSTRHNKEVNRSRQSAAATHEEPNDEPTPLETKELADFIQVERKEAKKRRKEVKICVEENTIAYEFLKDICEQSKTDSDSDPLIVNNLKWVLRSSELAIKPFPELINDCNSDGASELLGVIVWEPLATWMTMVKGASSTKLKLVPIHFATNELGRPRHLSYELVVRKLKIGRMNAKEKEFRIAVQKLVYELWYSANHLNYLRKESANYDTIRQLAKYFAFTDSRDISEIDDETIERTLKAVGGILYSVRWDVEGASALL